MVTTGATSAVRAAQALATPLPALLLAADRVAATVAQGLHGRRRPGMGESFWQFRPHAPGGGGRIDWRRSARADRLFVRDTEWDAAQTLALWLDAGAGMRWRSADSLPTKHDRALLLLLATASLALRAGERVRLLDAPTPPGGLAPLAEAAAALPDRRAPALLPPPHAQAILFTDALDLAAMRDLLARLAALPVRGDLVQVLDPAERALPYTGRVRFTGPPGDARLLLAADAAGLRDAYAAALAAHQDELRALCHAAGWRLHLHGTDDPPATALLGLYSDR